MAPGRMVSLMLSCPSTKLTLSMNIFHSTPVMAAGSVGMKVGMLTMAAILVDQVVLVSEVLVGAVGADDQVGGGWSGRYLGLVWGLWLQEGVEDPGAVFTAPTEGNPIEFYAGG